MRAGDGATKRKPLKLEVFDALHEGILSGRYAAGEWLRQEEISRRLGVSMTPVREALDLLVSSGLAERAAYRGVRVLRMSSPDILDSYELRLLLEAVASPKAAEAISPEQLAGLHELLADEAELTRSGNLPGQREVSRSLHSGIVAASGNLLLHRIYLEVLKTFPDWMLYEHLYRHPELLADSVRNEHAEHQGIVDALERGDPELAMQRSVEHVLQRGRELETYLGIPRHALELREAQIQHLMPGTRRLTAPVDKETT
jgi:DNA-binding GntR family transcriptional regulator